VTTESLNAVNILWNRELRAAHYVSQVFDCLIKRSWGSTPKERKNDTV